MAAKVIPAIGMELMDRLGEAAAEVGALVAADEVGGGILGGEGDLIGVNGGPRRLPPIPLSMLFTA